MIDIETYGTAPGSVILSIGAVFFDPNTGELGAEFYKTIDRKSSKKFGLTTDPKTVSWWLEQDEKIRERLFIDAAPLNVVLAAFSMWLKANCPKSKYPWGNSARFDLGLLDAAYTAVGSQPVWAYWNEMCYRTIMNLVPSAKGPKPTEAHDPIVDCKYQIENLVRALKVLKIKV